MLFLFHYTWESNSPITGDPCYGTYMVHTWCQSVPLQLNQNDLNLDYYRHRRIFIPTRKRLFVVELCVVPGSLNWFCSLMTHHTGKKNPKTFFCCPQQVLSLTQWYFLFANAAHTSTLRSKSVATGQSGSSKACWLHICCWDFFFSFLFFWRGKKNHWSF